MNSKAYEAGVKAYKADAESGDEVGVPLRYTSAEDRESWIAGWNKAKREANGIPLAPRLYKLPKVTFRPRYFHDVCNAMKTGATADITGLVGRVVSVTIQDVGWEVTLLDVNGIAMVCEFYEH